MSHQGPHPTVLYSFPENDKLVDAVAEFVLKAQNDAIKKRGAFCLAISGGSLPNNLKGLIGKEGVQWDKWLVIFFGSRDRRGESKGETRKGRGAVSRRKKRVTMRRRGFLLDEDGGPGRHM
jgi:hypothetical protein